MGIFIDSLVVGRISKKMFTPFNHWTAYKLGIIDENGILIRDVNTTAEAKAWTILDRFVSRMKRVVITLTPSGADPTITVAWLFDVDLEKMNTEKNKII